MGKTIREKLFGRHILSWKVFDSRNKWVRSFFREHKESGQHQESTSRKIWNKASSFFIRTDRKITRQCDIDYKEVSIVSIQPIEVQDVWDIEVETDHSYIANGFINHNSADSPSMQNIPVRETPVFRESFIAREGNKIVDADWSQQEYFVSAYVSADPKMKEICNSGQDVYIRNAKVMYGVDINKQDLLRKRMKAIVLGIDYGLTEYGLAAKEDISLEEAAKFILDFHRAFPTFSRWMDEQRRQKNYVETVIGRRLYLNRYSKQCENNALNSPIQGTASDMLKKAIANIRKGWDFGCPFGLVAPVHDELVFDVPEKVALDVAKFVKSEMERAANEMCPGLNFRSDVAIGDSWACKE